MSEKLIKDRTGEELKAGDVCIYTERPYSNYADSIVELYEDCGTLKIRTLVVNGISGNEYVIFDGTDDRNLELTEYTRNTLGEPTNVADLIKIENLKADDVTIDLANKIYPLS